MQNNERLLPPPDNTETDSTDSQPITIGDSRRNPNGQFGPNNCANPKGRPLGSRARASLLARAVLEAKAGELAEKVMAEALAGNPIAYKLCLERLISIPQDSPVALHLPEPGSKSSDTAPERMFDAHNALVRAVANGEVSPSEAETLSRVFNGRLRSWEALEYHRRLENVERGLRRYEKKPE